MRDEDPTVVQIIDTNLRVRAWRALRKLGVVTVADIGRVSECTLFSLRGVGPSTVNEIRRVAAEYGVSFCIAPAELREGSLVRS